MTKGNNKEKRDIVIILSVIGVIIFLFLWRFVFTTPQPDAPPIATIKTAPKIDFNYLKEDYFKSFQKYETIEPLAEDLMGRDEPFLPY